MMTDVALIVRAAGERTEAACLDIAEAQCGPAFCVTRERPFWRALAASLEAGLDAAAEWTLILDADILLAPGAVDAALAQAAALGDGFYAIDLMVLDRGFAGPAHAGAHLYRTSLFARARRLLADAEHDIRPETFVCQRMAASGFPTHQSTLVVGLHDFEQYYRDLYRKQLVRSYKFRGLWHHMLDRCRRHYREDDFKVMLWGFLDGLRAGQAPDAVPPVLDALAYRAAGDDVLALLGLDEKPPLAPSAATHALPANRLRAFTPDDLYRQAFPLPYALVTDQPDRACLDSLIVS